MNTNSEWGIFVEPDHTVRKYYCGNCRIFSGLMHRRVCSDNDNNVHREYKVVCEKCSQAHQIHWSKNLAEHTWAANNPNLGKDYVSVNVAEMLKKGGSNAG